MITSENLLMDANGAAALCGVSRSTWFKLAATGKLPRPIKLGRVTRWNREELQAWIAAGCPAREKWDNIRAKA
ncbi:MAG: helix-turn-helix domain-containing protein [Planctomycetaceae bacterium]|nr:helix-turn-helix domain-containing protein [Planctomycetaceae bacterium]